MTFLPIVSRELRLASRRRGTYWLRSGAALLVMLVGTWVFVMFRMEPPKDLAMTLFCILTGGSVLFAILSGPRSTADSISEEKREGTLGLLFLTDLRGYDVVLGKLVAGSLSSIYCIVAVLPMMAIPLLMGGGITLAEFVRTSLVTVNALLFSLTLGIFVSAMSHSAQRAAALSALLLLFFAGIVPAFGALIAGFTKAQSVNLLFLMPSVGFSYYLAFDGPYKSSSSWFWVSMAIIHGASWVCLVLASLTARRSWQDRPKGDRSLRWRDWWNNWTYGHPRTRASFRRHLLEISPPLWLVARIRSKPMIVWIFLGLTASGWGWGWWAFRHEWLNAGVYVCTAAVLNLALRCWFAGEVTRVLAEARRVGALELLLSTPLSVSDILRGQWLALVRQFLGPVLTVLVIECVFMLWTVREAVPDEERLFWFALWIAGMVLFASDLVALYWVGMWQGLTAKNPVRAAGGSLLRVLVVPWIAYCLVLLIIILGEFTQQPYHRNPGWKFFVGLWFGLGVGADLAFGAWARQKLLTEFRMVAQEAYVSSAESWKKWLRTLKPSVSESGPASWDPEVRA
jgi:ABC-type Na+ efflux pump permease subunit